MADEALAIATKLGDRNARLLRCTKTRAVGFKAVRSRPTWLQSTVRTVVVLMRELANLQIWQYATSETTTAELRAQVRQMVRSQLESLHHPLQHSERLLQLCQQTHVGAAAMRRIQGHIQPPPGRAAKASKAKPWCIGCRRVASAIPEVVAQAEADDMTPEDTARDYGSYNVFNAHFACMECYVRMGAPGGGWKAP